MIKKFLIINLITIIRLRRSRWKPLVPLRWDFFFAKHIKSTPYTKKTSRLTTQIQNSSYHQTVIACEARQKSIKLSNYQTIKNRYFMDTLWIPYGYLMDSLRKKVFLFYTFLFF